MTHFKKKPVSKQEFSKLKLQLPLGAKGGFQNINLENPWVKFIDSFHSFIYFWLLCALLQHCDFGFLQRSTIYVTAIQAFQKG